jgi:hypothetical protein
MIPSMVSLVTVPSAASGVRRVRISVPLIDCLIDGVRYFRPDTLPPPAGDELRPMSRPKIDKVLGKQELRKARQYREQRELEELANMLGDPC